MFNWLSGKQRSNLPEPTALQTQKSRQIEQLKSFNQNVTEIQRDVEYRVNMVVNGCTISLYITLPPQFPQEKPIVKLSPCVSHPWVNEQMVVTGSAGVNNFMVHSDLGKVVRDIVEEFNRSPPTVLPPQYGFAGPPYGVGPPSVGPMPNLPSTDPQTRFSPYPPQHLSYQAGMPGFISQMPMQNLSDINSTPSAVNSGSTSRAGTHGFGDNFGMPNLDNHAQNTSSTLGSFHMPEMPLCFPQLRDMSKAELMELTDDEDKLLQILEDLPEVHQLAADREKFTNQNEELAEINLAVKPVLEDKKRILLEKYDIFNDTKKKYDDNSHKQDQLRQRFDVKLIQDNLKVAVLQAEEESESIAEHFLEGKLRAEEFTKKFMEIRKLGHLRKAKEERLNSSIHRQGQSF